MSAYICFFIKYSHFTFLDSFIDKLKILQVSLMNIHGVTEAKKILLFGQLPEWWGAGIQNNLQQTETFQSVSF